MSGSQFPDHQAITQDVSKPLLIQTFLWLQLFNIQIPPTKIIEQSLRKANNIVLTFRCFFMRDSWEEDECWIWNLLRIQTIYKLGLSKKWRWIKENGKWFPATLVQNYLINTVKILAFIAVKAINQMSSSSKSSCFIHLINTWDMGQNWTAGFDPHSCAKFFIMNS